MIYRLVMVLVTAAGISLAGSQVGAERVLKEHKIAQLEWQQAMLQAVTPAQKAAVFQKRPDTNKFGMKMENELDGMLKEAWTMPYAIWLLENHPGLSLQKLKYLLGEVEKFHLQSADAGVFAIRLASVQLAGEAEHVGLTALKAGFIDKLQKNAKSKEVQGQAALAKAMILRMMGDGGKLNGQRLKLLRVAVLDAAHAKVGDTTVGKFVEEELYQMTKLSTGMEGPNLAGKDSAGAAMSLKDFRGKVVLLVFWSSWENAEQTSASLQRAKQMFAGKPVEIMGVNRDSLVDLREIVKQDLMPGHHFSDPTSQLFHTYRVTQAPWCYVIDQKGVIQYAGNLGSFAELTISALLDAAKKP